MCAPSNVAVDQLAQKIHSTGIKVRVGVGDSLWVIIVVYSLQLVCC